MHICVINVGIRHLRTVSIIQKSLRGRRTNNLNQNSYSAKGDKYQKLACIQFEWEDLNEKNDNYNSPIDCYDPKTGLFHQVRGRISYYGTWALTRLEYEWNKKFETMQTGTENILKEFIFFLGKKL